MKKICSLLVLCATVVFASCSKDDPVTEPVPEGITVTTYDALLDAPADGRHLGRRSDTRHAGRQHHDTRGR